MCRGEFASLHGFTEKFVEINQDLATMNHFLSFSVTLNGSKYEIFQAILLAMTRWKLLC